MLITKYEHKKKRNISEVEFLFLLVHIQLLWSWFCSYLLPLFIFNSFGVVISLQIFCYSYWTPSDLILSLSPTLYTYWTPSDLIPPASLTSNSYSTRLRVARVFSYIKSRRWLSHRCHSEFISESNVWIFN